MHGGTAHQRLRTEPAPGRAAAALGAEHHGNVHVTQAGTDTAVAQRRLNAGATKDKLVNRHAAAVAQAHIGGVGGGAAFDEHVTRDAQYAGHRHVHLAADARLVVQQIHQVVARPGGDHLVVHRPTQPVVSHAERLRLQRDPVNTGERQAAADLHRIA